MNHETLSLEEFERRYTYVPNPNPHNEGAPACNLFETFEPDLEFVRSQPVKHVFTLVEDTDEQLYLTAGFHLANRIGFFVVREEWQDAAEIYLYGPKGDSAAEPRDHSFLARFRASEYTTLRKLIGEGQADEANRLLETICTRTEECLWITVFEHRHGRDIYLAVGDEAPDATALVSRLSDWEGAHASETVDMFAGGDIRGIKQSESFQVSAGACPRCSKALPAESPEGCSACSLCPNCCQHARPAHLISGGVDEATHTQ